MNSAVCFLPSQVEFLSANESAQLMSVSSLSLSLITLSVLHFTVRNDQISDLNPDIHSPICSRLLNLGLWCSQPRTDRFLLSFSQYVIPFVLSASPPSLYRSSFCFCPAITQIHRLLCAFIAGDHSTIGNWELYLMHSFFCQWTVPSHHICSLANPVCFCPFNRFRLVRRVSLSLALLHFTFGYYLAL